MARNQKREIDQYSYDSSTRVTLPTSETSLSLEEGQLAEDEYRLQKPATNWPRLNWRRGSDADSVSYGRLFIHEKVSPAEFMSGLLKDKELQRGLWFDDFNNLPYGAHYEPYVHDGGNWSNRLIKSTSQRAMASLLHDEAMAGQVDLIYMDPPYNINFRSNFQGLIDSTSTGEKWEDIPSDVRAVKAFRDSYQDGVHSYLDQLRVQLIHGRELLKESGSFVMQIGPDNLHYVAVMMSEVFGHDNHVATVPFVTGTNSSTRMLPEIGNWLVWFSKEKSEAKYRQLYEQLTLAEKIEHMSSYAMLELPDQSIRNLTKLEEIDPSTIPEGARLFRRMRLDSSHVSTTGRSEPWQYDPHDYPERPRHYPDRSNAYPCPTGRQWRVSLSGLRAIASRGRMVFSADEKTISFKRYAEEVPGRVISSVWGRLGPPLDKRYIVETPPIALQRILLMNTDPGDLVLDLTCGSGAMPLMAERWGRRWIAVDSSAVSIAIARERIATSIHPYHMLQDSEVGHRHEYGMARDLLQIEEGEKFQPKTHYQHDPAQGFVLERQLRISAGTLAYGFKPGDVIYHPDRPLEEKGKRRVSSAFTVESDLPYIARQPEESPFIDKPAVDSPSVSLETMRNMEEALLASGIQIPASEEKDGEVFRVIDLDHTVEIPDVTHTGRIAGTDGDAREAVFYLCREDEVAGPFQTRNLAAVARHRRAAFACIVGFGHEGDTGSVVRHQGNLTILKVMANRDLMIPGLQHKVGDNAFVVISEPDLEIHYEPENRISIEVRGLTTFNPKTGQVEPTGDRRIAGIMTDTAYDLESFRVCLLNLPQTGQIADRRLRQIRNAFKSEIDDAKWKRMRSCRTLPFDRPPSGGRVAVKVIDQTGVEHMKVLEIS